MCRLACFRLHVSEWEKNWCHLKDVVAECSLYKSNTKRSTVYPQSLQHTFIIQFCAFECFIIHLYLYTHTVALYTHVHYTELWWFIFIYRRVRPQSLVCFMCCRVLRSDEPQQIQALTTAPSCVKILSVHFQNNISTKNGQDPEYTHKQKYTKMVYTGVLQTQ